MPSRRVTPSGVGLLKHKKNIDVFNQRETMVHIVSINVEF